MDALFDQLSGILSITVCGISVPTIIGMIIYCIRVAAANKKNLTITTETIEEAFKNVVLPKNIKLDISNKIEKPIKEGLEAVSDKLNGALERVEKGEQMMLKILTLFTHFQKLPDETREEIEDFINKETNTTEIKL